MKISVRRFSLSRIDTFLLRYNPDDPKENNSLASELDRPWYTADS